MPILSTSDVTNAALSALPCPARLAANFQVFVDDCEVLLTQDWGEASRYAREALAWTADL